MFARQASPENVTVLLRVRYFLVIFVIFQEKKHYNRQPNFGLVGFGCVC